MSAVTSVLIVDDEPSVRNLMVRWAESLGMQPSTAQNAYEAVRALQTGAYDVAVIDVMMPGRNGLWLASELRRDYPQTAVVLATAHVEELDPRTTAVADLLIKPFKRERFLLALDRGREWRRHAIEEIEWHQRLTDELTRQTEAVIVELERNRATGDEADVLFEILRSRVPDVALHSERVRRYALAIASALGETIPSLPRLELAARFHDLGKAATPHAVLSKPSPLSAVEAGLMRAHVDSGADILEHTHSLADLAPLVRASHEWFNGRGYPRNLAGERIPLESRIIGVADAYDAMTQDRGYRSRLSAAEAISEVLRSVPAQFDPDVVGAFLSILNRH